MTGTDKKDFLINELPNVLKNLDPESEGSFGLMTPQHMVEHLTMSMRSASHKYEGEREKPANERQLGMQKFIKNGSVLSHRPSNKTKADLPPLKQNTFDKALAELPMAVQQFYDFRDANPGYIPYASFMGELPFEEVELFHYMHVRYHLWQFGLLEKYP